MTEHVNWPLILRKILLGNPSRAVPMLSPDGLRVAWRAPVDGVMNIWVAPTGAIDEAKPLTRLIKRPPVWHDWSADGQFVMFLKDENGDENYNFFVVDLTTGELRNLMPNRQASVQVRLRSPDLPGKVLLAVNERDARWHDLWLVDLATGARELVYENNYDFEDIVCDWQGRARLGRRSEPSKGGEQIYLLDNGYPEPWLFVPFDDSFGTEIKFFNRAGTTSTCSRPLGVTHPLLCASI